MLSIVPCATVGPWGLFYTQQCGCIHPKLLIDFPPSPNLFGNCTFVSHAFLSIVKHTAMSGLAYLFLGPVLPASRVHTGSRIVGSHENSVLGVWKRPQQFPRQLRRLTSITSASSQLLLLVSLLGCSRLVSGLPDVLPPSWPLPEMEWMIGEDWAPGWGGLWPWQGCLRGAPPRPQPGGHTDLLTPRGSPCRLTPQPGRTSQEECPSALLWPSLFDS